MTEDPSAGGVLREPASDTGAQDVSARMWDAGGRGSRGRGRGGRRRRGGGGEDGGREQLMVPKAEFESYYGRPVLKPPAWNTDIAGYLFAGGLSAGCTLLAAGADLTGRPALRRVGRLGAVGTLAASTFLLIHDLGRPERFHHMLRVAKPTSAMSMGSWTLAAYAPGVGLAAAAELMPAALRRSLLGRLVDLAVPPAVLVSVVTAPGIASYTAVLLSQTAVPAWHEAHHQLPFVFTGSAAAASGGFGMLLAPCEEAAPARRFAAIGSAIEILATRRMEKKLGIVDEAYHCEKAGRRMRAAKVLTAVGLACSFAARRSRAAAVVGGLSLLSGSAALRLGVYEAGVASTKDPKYVVVPQRQRIAEQGPTRVPG